MNDNFELSTQHLKAKLFFVVSMFFSSAVLFYFYNHYWYPPDDGAYAHVADRILAGDVLNLDVHDVHMGYINFLHAGALSLFGNDMASLRIPLVILGVIQSAIIFALLKPKGLGVALIAVATITSLSFVQYLNPTANWYALFLTLLLIGCFEWIPEKYKYKIVLIGYILVTLFLFRQLSAVFVSLGAVTFILYKNHEVVKFWDHLISKLIFAIMMLGLSGYLYLKISISATLLFGLWPLVILIYGLMTVTVSNNKTLKIMGGLSLGGALAAVPIFIYHIYHGSLLSWYNDTVVSALVLSDLSFIKIIHFADYLYYSLGSVLQMSSLVIVMNGFYWMMLILASSVLGFLLFSKVLFKNKNLIGLSSLPMIGVFYGLASVHYQIPIYLYYTVGLSLCGILWMMDLSPVRKRSIIMLIAGLICFNAISFHAAQPSDRSMVQILQGEAPKSDEKFLGGHVQLWVNAREAEQYEHINELVQKNVKPEETIFAFPTNSEIYYITRRTNPFRFFNSAFGMSNSKQFDYVLSTFETIPPRMVFFKPDDKYVTDNALKIVEYINIHYTLLETVEGIECYILNSD